MSIEALVGRTAKVVNAQTHVGSLSSTAAADADHVVFTHTLTAVTGHTYMAIASGSAMLDTTTVDHQSRHYLDFNGNRVASCRLEIVRGQWPSKGGMPIRMIGVWQPSSGQVTVRWTAQRGVAWNSEWVLSEGRHTFTILDLGPS